MAKPWVRCKITAELLADAHFGTGSGGSGIDALVARDRYNRPVIWASHVEGVLRDAARRLRGDQSADDFFGRAGGQQQWAIFTSLYTADAPESHIWRSAARQSFDNRAPKDDTLRTIEFVPKGTKFEGQVELPEHHLPLLERLVKEVDALGSGRASGTGWLKLSLEELQQEIVPKEVKPTEHLRLLLRNIDPVCITATATPDNLIPSLAFVPGRALLGALASLLREAGKHAVASLLTAGRISVSDALPLPEAPADLKAVEVLPAPLSLQSEKPKGSAGPVPWWAQPKVGVKRIDAWTTTEKLKRPEDDLFVYREHARADWIAFRPALRVRLRNGRPDPRQLKPSLFAVEEIAEDTYFVAELQGTLDAMKQLAEGLKPVLEGRRWLRVGRSGAPVEVVDIAWMTDTMQERSISDSAISNKTFRLTLTSDLLVRDEFLRWRTALDEEALQELLGTNNIHLKRSTQDWVMVHGFNRASRLWRMPAAAIRRGSVFEVSGEGIQALASRVVQGQWLGERTHEGFGRFRLDEALPGVTNGMVANGKDDSTEDVPDEAIAAKTHNWFEDHEELASPASGTDRKPSLSQWFDLVSELERGNANAILNRLNPTKAGAQSWKHPKAKAILEKLQTIPNLEMQARYARFFVRWLRAEMRKREEV
uniref:CRISPR system related protein, RAMP superfamily n=1 Tax=uncultured Bacteroidota bacterium TaxID=152509 RepID=H5S8L7_9BACT|nr:CRISPR system related protein, RAMP superfamily [uncultured Bacteroidetes bacterium]